MRPAIDPRRGDIEDDASSSKRRSLLSLAGSLLAEISLPKLAVAFTLLIVIPSWALGIAPIVAAIWFGKLSSKLATGLTSFWPAILLVIVGVVGWFGAVGFGVAAVFWTCRYVLDRRRKTAPRRSLGDLGQAMMAAGMAIFFVATLSPI